MRAHEGKFLNPFEYRNICTYCIDQNRSKYALDPIILGKFISAPLLNLSRALRKY